MHNDGFSETYTVQGTVEINSGVMSINIKSIKMTYVYTALNMCNHVLKNVCSLFGQLP